MGAAWAWSAYVADLHNEAGQARCGHGLLKEDGVRVAVDFDEAKVACHPDCFALQDGGPEADEGALKIDGGLDRLVHGLGAVAADRGGEA